MSEVIGDPTFERPRGGDEPLRLMAVHAHPDDESSKGAATMAKLRRPRASRSSS